MNLNPLKYLKTTWSWLLSLGWNKEDCKRIIIYILLLIFSVYYINKYLIIDINLNQGKYDSLRISGSVDANVSAPLGGLDVRINQ